MSGTSSTVAKAGSGDVPAGQFTLEQKEYLAGFMAGVAQRSLVPYVGTTANGQITAEPEQGGKNLAAPPSEETVFGTPRSELCKQDQWKLEENPLDIWDKLL